MDALDIVKEIGSRITLDKSGACYLGLCPFHQEAFPSFSVNPRTNTYHCFGCGISGDAKDFIRRYDEKSSERDKVIPIKRGRKKKP